MAELETLNDEAFMDASESWSEPTVDAPAEDNTEEPTGETEEELDAEQVDNNEDTQEDNQGTEEEDSDEEAVEDDQGEAGESEYEVEDDTENQDVDPEKETDSTNDTEGDFDYKSGYEELLSPFKAGGKDIKIDNIDDARKLMQMGAGFASNQRKIKPHLKIVKALRKNGLLDPDKVNHLIDIGLGKPEAIAKLLKDNKVDPLDIDTDSVGDYKPTNHEVSDQEFDLDQAIDGIRGSESYDKSIEIMGKQWDKKSQTIISENPQIVGIIDEHVSSGVFDIIQSHVDKEKTLGRLQGVSDVEAYYMAAEALKGSGALSNKNTEKNEEPVEPDKAEVAKKKKEVKRANKRKAAGPAKGKKAKSKPVENFDDLSDEEFEKLYGSTSVV